MSELDFKLPRVDTQKQFMDFLENTISPPKDEDGYPTRSGRLRELKTYILESHELFSTFTADSFSYEISDTGLNNLKILRTTDRKSGHASEFFLDINDDRFPVLHTNDRSEVTSRIVETLTRDLDHTFDHVWFYSDMLKQLSEKTGNTFKGFGVRYSDEHLRTEESADSDIEDLALSMSGSMAERMKRIIEEDPDIRKRMAFNKIRIARGSNDSIADSIQDDIHNTGYFSVKKGRSIQDHMQLVDIAKKEYRETVSRIEDDLIGVKTVDGKTMIDGDSFDFKFPDTVESLPSFLEMLFNSAQPFKLWGIKTKIHDDYFKILAIDLHTGSPVDFEISKDMMRMYLSKGNCGNIVLRLLTNLQIYHDSGTECIQLN